MSTYPGSSATIEGYSDVEHEGLAHAVIPIIGCVELKCFIRSRRFTRSTTVIWFDLLDLIGKSA